ncbi:hypothetical protein FSP39_019592 [Pinctada imbricata]|uniref:ABC transporter domain-containing protein n=1 Tax=Pinctada imbricata TaxID=66713 RepID=A0AA88YE56_PINIB|nr:hypothetical protein FSP39_019592 [Pinctada imbricata]
MELVFNDLCVHADKKQILNDVSGVAYPGQLLAIMGPSGAGKTTLLNAIAGRLPVTSGEISLDGVPVNKAARRKICYVLQQDIFFPNLTLHETLNFTAMIRLPDSMSRTEKLKKVDDIVEALDLTKCLDTVIGDMWIRGLSGGEKKRANIACELITDPTMILLDEPTSGLDYSTAYSLIQTLKVYAKVHMKTVIATIHQPSSYIFYQFDTLLLISEGQLAYYGATNKVTEFFVRAEIPMDSHYNPADYMLEKLKEDEKTRQKIISTAYEMRKDDDWPKELQKTGAESNIKTTERSDKGNTNVLKKYKKIGSQDKVNDEVRVSLVNLDEDDQEVERDSKKTAKWPSGFITQYTQITIRTFRNSKSLIFSKLKMIETIILCVLISLIWFQLPRVEETLRDRMGVIFYMSMHWGFTPLFDTVTSFPSERIVINKERSSGWYRLSSYYLAKMTSELPLILLQPIFFITIVYWSVGLNGVTAFFATLGTIFIHSITGQSIGLFLGIACMDIRKAMTIATVFIMAFMLLGGFYTRHLPSWLFWVKYLSFLHYTYHALMLIEFQDGPQVQCAVQTSISESQFYSCANNATHIPSAEVLQHYGITWSYWQYICPLFIFIVVFRLAGYLTLRFIQKPH